MPRHSEIDCCGNGLISQCIVIRESKTFVESLWFDHVRIWFLCTVFGIRDSNVRIGWKGFDRFSDVTQTIGALSFVSDFSWTKTRGQHALLIEHKIVLWDRVGNWVDGGLTWSTISSTTVAQMRQQKWPHVGWTSAHAPNSVRHFGVS